MLLIKFLEDGVDDFFKFSFLLVKVFIGTTSRSTMLLIKFLEDGVDDFFKFSFLLVKVFIGTTSRSTMLLIKFLEDRVDDFFKFSFLLVKVFLLGIVVRLQPIKDIVHGLFNGIFVLLAQFSCKFLLIFQLRFQSKCEALKTILSLNLLPHLSIFFSKLLSGFKHSFNFSF